MRNPSQSDGYLYNGESGSRALARAEPKSLAARILNKLGLQLKAATPAPDYGNNNYLPDFSYRYSPWNRHRTTQIDYKAEVGNLDSSSLVMAVVNWTSTQLPEAQPVVQHPGENNAYETEWGHEAANLIRRPNPFTTWAEDCAVLSLGLWIDGNFHWYKQRDNSGKVIALWYLPWFLVKERWPGDGGDPVVPASKAENDYLSHYEYRIPGKDPILYKQSDIVHLKRGKDPNNPRRGIGAFGPVISEVYGDNKAALFTATILRNMGIVVPMLTPKGEGVTMNETQALALKEKWVQQTTGDNIGIPIVSALPIEAIKFAWSPEELDLKELRKVPESRIAAITGIPAAMLQFLVGLENGTSYAAYAEARKQGYESVIVPMQTMIAEQLTWQLLNEFEGENKRKLKLIFDTSTVRVLQEDRDALYARTTRALASGGITINQFLASLGKPTVEGLDIHFIPSLATPMTTERLIEKAKEEPQPPPEPVNPVDAAALAKFAELERWFEGLEAQMKSFVSEQNGLSRR